MKTALQESRTDKIVAALGQDIDDGVYLPGHALDERQLAERFGVSRTPIREALQRLSAEGVVRIVPRQGVFVARMSLAELREMFELASELEASCAKFCATRMQEPWKGAMLEAVQRGDEAAARADWVAYSQVNVDFHNALYEGCRNRPLALQVRAARRRTQVYRSNAFQVPGRMEVSAREHRQIAEAIGAGDGARAQQLMLGHVHLGGSGFGEFISRMSAEEFESSPHELAYPPATPIER